MRRACFIDRVYFGNLIGNVRRCFNTSVICSDLCRNSSKEYAENWLVTIFACRRAVPVDCVCLAPGLCSTVSGAFMIQPSTGHNPAPGKNCENLYQNWRPEF